MSEQILIVEDDLAMSVGIRDALEMHGYQVELAENGLEALKLLESYQPDLIISDIMMPEMDGYEFLEKVRRHPEWTTVPFIFLTARSQQPDIRAGKQLGADDYLVKSVDLDDLFIVVRAKLDRSLALRQKSRQDLEDLKRQVLNMLSHEFRTPLTYITGYVDLIQDGEWSPDELQKFLIRIKSGSVRLHRLVEDFLLLVRFETDDARQAYALEKRPFNNWRSVVARIFDAHHDQAAQRAVELAADIQPELPLVEAHETYLENAINRLVDNAVKFSKPGGGKVTVKVYSADGRVICQVHDTGLGIPAAELPHLFERFHQINRQKIEQQGAGVGLAIVKSIVDLHHGEVVCRSTEGQGSEMTISLPVLSD